MKLLIVDDQLSVVRGLLCGVSWADMGIAQVFTAQNALDARAVIKQESVDIVLCDIEMPVESGMDLFRWVKSSGYLPYFIFLTSHADFSYAQEAIRLGAFDYVVQPAPYAEVERVVKKALDQIEKDRSENVKLDYGRMFGEQKKTILGDAIGSFLKGRGGAAYMQSLAAMELGPALDEHCWLVLIHINRWHDNAELWEMNLLELSLENVVSEIFTSQGQNAGFAYMEPDVFAMVLWGRGGKEMPKSKLMQHLQFFSSACGQYFRCDTACYISGPDVFEMTPKHWEELCNQKGDNVLNKSGIFDVEAERTAIKHTYRMPRIRHWHDLFKDGYCDAVEQEALELLDELCVGGAMNQEMLFDFYQDFMQMIYVTAAETGQALKDIFQSYEAMELYRGGMKSVEQMKRLIHYVTGYFKGSGAADCKTLVQDVMDYIAENLEEELRRDELAAHCHVNADHLTRVFKKETGLSLKEYITTEKMKAAQGLLRTTNLPVSFVAAKMGYCNFSHFSYAYKKAMGRSPQEERGEKT